MLESEFYTNYVRSRLSEWGDVCRVENTCDSGMPDINFAIDNVHGWIELKIVRNELYHFEKFQLAWLKRRLRHSQDVWVLTLHNRDAVVRLHHASQILKVETETKRKWLVMNYDAVETTLEFNLNSNWLPLRQVLIHKN